LKLKKNKGRTVWKIVLHGTQEIAMVAATILALRGDMDIIAVAAISLQRAM
jgi:hypothetical protein